MLFILGDVPSQYRVVCGEHNLDATEGDEVAMQVTEIRIHKDYNGASKGRDIAVYKVDDSPMVGRVRAGDGGRGGIYPVCLPRVDEEYYGEDLNVAGWGTTSERRVRGTTVLVRGLSNTPQHVTVTSGPCKDPTSRVYPEGLICASAPG